MMMACENGEIECAECDGHGYNNIIRCCGNALASGACCGNGIDDTEECDFCRGQGWRAATDDELANMAEAQAEDAASGEPPMSVQEMYEAAYRLKMELRR